MKTGTVWRPLLWSAPSPAAARRHPFLYGLYLLGPWCNRIRGARLTIGGKTYQLRSNLSDGSAMHGDIYARPWTVRLSSASKLQAELDSRHFPDFNFPAPLKFSLSVALRNKSVSLELSVTNIGSRAVPVALGFHPFFRRPAQLLLPARTVSAQPGPFPVRFRSRRVDEWIDTARTPLDHDFSSFMGRGAKLAVGPEKIPVGLRWSGNVSDVFVYAPRRHEGKKAPFVCVEPLTMRPGNLAGISLAPGRVRKLRLTISL